MNEETERQGDAQSASTSDSSHAPQRDLPAGYVPYDQEPINRRPEVDDHGWQPLESEEEGRVKGVYPLPPETPVEVGGTPEDREALDEELSR